MKGLNLSLNDNILLLAYQNKRCGIKLIDNLVVDAHGLKRMITQAELKELNRIAKNKELIEKTNILFFKKSA